MVLPAALAVGVLGLAAPASAATHPHPSGHRTATGPRLLSSAVASARARSSHKPVPVTAMTTTSASTVANPNGTFTATESLLPVRALRNGTWIPLNATLRRNADGTISPAVSTAHLVLSGGGTGALASMTMDGRTLALSWPGRLPVPALSGATATYRDVLPGVDLVVTATPQGGFSDVLVIKNATAAANPRLAHLDLATTTSRLMVTAGKSGTLAARADPDAPAIFTADAPRMWDSTSLPAHTATVTGPGHARYAAISGLPAASSAAAPGAAAHVTQVPVTLSAGAITLAPPAAALTGGHVSYPVYIDPTWTPVSSNNSNWTQVDKGYPTTTYWRESSDLQAGDCAFANCANVEVARTFFEIPIPSALASNTTVDSADLYMTDEWAPSCTASDDQLWSTDGIGSSTDWNNQPTWLSEMQEKSFAYGYSSSCAYYTHDLTWSSSALTALMQRAASSNWSNATLGIRAASESDSSQWKQFLSGSGDITMSVTYADPPNQPSSLSTSPGGTCQTNSNDATQIGNDDVEFDAYVSDNTQDTPLSTRYLIYNSAGTTVYDSSAEGTSYSSGNKTTAELPLSRTIMQGLLTGGAATTFHWHVVTTNDDSESSSNSETCYFTYNPNGPSTPMVTWSATSAQIGTSVTATVTDPGCGSGSNPCPVSYTYQLGPFSPTTVTASGGAANGSITIDHLGPIMFTLYGTASNGNLSPIYPKQLVGDSPAYPVPDGYFSDGPDPDVITPGTNASDPSLWLKQGNGPGTLGSTVDIGSTGTTLNPGSDGPADWADAQTLQGNFTGDGVPDAMAYYTTGPHQGTGEIIGGAGDWSPLNSASGNSYTVPYYELANSAGNDPTDLVAAGNASQQGTGFDDLIGISNSGNGSDELDLYVNQGAPGDYAIDNPGDPDDPTAPLATEGPNGSSWSNFTIATAQPGAYPSNVQNNNTDDVVLFALNNSTGVLWESTNPADSTSSIIGSSGSTWTKITTPWGSSPPTLYSADTNAAGDLELWTESSGGFTAYTLSGSTLTAEAAAQTFNAPLGEWPLTDGIDNPSSTTAVDTITGNLASLNGGVTWGSDDYFSSDLQFDGSSGYLTPPAGTIPSTNTTPKISLWFKTTTPGGVLASLQTDTFAPGTTTTKGFNPVLYIGTNGKLYAEWWSTNGTNPSVSAQPVDDGQWHHVILTAYPNGQTLYLDNQSSIYQSGSINISGSNPTNFTIGAGYNGGSWPEEPDYQKDGNDGYPNYFNGSIADVIYSFPGGP
jgi:hypothetical protein